MIFFGFSKLAGGRLVHVPCHQSPPFIPYTPTCSFELQIPTTFFHIVRCRSTTESAVLMCFNVSWVVSLILRLSWCYHDSLLRRQHCFCVLERAQDSGSMISRSWGPGHRGLSLASADLDEVVVHKLEEWDGAAREPLGAVPGQLRGQGQQGELRHVWERGGLTWPFAWAAKYFLNLASVSSVA